MLDDKPFLRIAVAIRSKNEIILEMPIVLFALVLFGCGQPYAKSCVFTPAFIGIGSRKAATSFAGQYAIVAPRDAKKYGFSGASETVQIAPTAATIVHDLASQIELTVRGSGIVSAPAASVSELLAAGKLARVLPDWSISLEALYLYFPSRRHQSAALRAFIAFLKNRTA